VDRSDNVFVADLNNNRVVLLGATLADLEDVATGEYVLNEPWGLHLDEVNRHLYIAEWTSTGRVLILTT